MPEPPSATLTDPLPPPARGLLRGAAWAWPMVLALAFTAAVAAWLQWSDAQDAEAEQATLITDSLSLESRISAWVDDERRRVQALADELPDQVDDEVLLRQPAVPAGLQRVWVGVTVLDAGNRLVAQVPSDAPRALPGAASSGIDDGGLSAHLAAPRRGGGRLVVRFAPVSLLRQVVPWWLARKYDVRLVDSLGQLIASSNLVPAGPRSLALAQGRHESHRVSLEPALTDTWLELTVRERRIPWWQTLPLALMGAFLALTAAATWTLRRRMIEVGRAEAQWRTEAAWRRAIEDSLTVGLRGRDLQGRVVHVNRAFCDLVGYRAEDLLGQLPPLPYWPADATGERMERHRRNLAGGAPPEGYETQWVRADGRSLEVMILEAPLVDALGKQVGWMGSIVDVSARKQAEERERRQREMLATQARLTTLGEVASALAHQLNQPLTAVAGYSAGVLRSLQGAGYDDPRVLDALRRLGEQAAEAGRIVQRIRGFLTRRAPQRERCELGPVVERALALQRRDLARLQIACRVELGDDLPAVDADPVLIEQVLINLVRNAADELAAAPLPRRLRVGAERVAGPGGEALRIDVDDSAAGLRGLGIEQLSAPFYSTKPEGMGMGLAICRSVIEAHRGALTAQPGPLGGARLSFTLPLAEAVAQEA